MAVTQKQLIDITLLGKYDEKIKGVISAKETALNETIGTIPAKVDNTTVSNAVEYVDAMITKVNGAASTLEGRVKANEDAIALLNNTDNTKVGSVANSIKVAIDAIVNADDPVGSIDKLNEIAAWIVDDKTGAAKMVADIAALKGSASDTSESVSIAGAKKYADEKVAGKNVTAEGESGANALVSASAAANKVTFSATDKLVAAVTRAEGAVLSLGKGTSEETYVAISVADGDDATVSIDDSALNTKIGAAKNGETAASGMYADIQGATNATVADVNEKVDALQLATEAQINALFA